jgi:hypothetical protein
MERVRVSAPQAKVVELRAGEKSVAMKSEEGGWWSAARAAGLVCEDQEREGGHTSGRPFNARHRTNDWSPS